VDAPEPVSQAGSMLPARRAKMVERTGQVLAERTPEVLEATSQRKAEQAELQLGSMMRKS